MIESAMKTPKIMMKQLFCMLIISISLQGFAQADLTNAYYANEEKDYDKAIEYLDKASQNPKSIAQEKYWRYRGDTYKNILTSPAHSAKYPDAAKLCIESYQKANELDKKQNYLKENQNNCLMAYDFLFSTGIQQYSAKDYCAAATCFSNSALIVNGLTMDGLNDTVKFQSTYYAGLSYEQCGKDQEAITCFQRSLDNGFEVLSSLTEMYLIQKKNNDPSAKATLAKARSMFPNDSNLLIEELNAFIDAQDFEGAIKLLEDLTTKEPNNDMYWGVAGTIYEKLGKTDQSLAAYEKALQINPKSFDANFGLGVIYFNMSEVKRGECDKIQPTPANQAKSDACKQEKKRLQTESLKYFESAYTENPSDRELLQNLKVIYNKLGMTEDAKRIDAELKK
jgi:tetratricopeptide (TPR) repeat protein